MNLLKQRKKMTNKLSDVTISYTNEDGTPVSYTRKINITYTMTLLNHLDRAAEECEENEKENN